MQAPHLLELHSTVIEANADRMSSTCGPKNCAEVRSGYLSWRSSPMSAEMCFSSSTVTANCEPASRSAIVSATSTCPGCGRATEWMKGANDPNAPSMASVHIAVQTWARSAR